jgi:predicted RNA binding protein with dsRBD fold (UPF0201 family)
MNDEVKSKYTYLEVVVEAKLNPTERKETISKILNYFVKGEVFVDERFDGKYLVIRSSGNESLQIFGDWIRQARQLDTIRKRLFKSITGNITALYFNRQAAAMGRIALVDIEDSPPLGSIALQIISDSLEHVIDEIAPKTHNGRELTEQEWKNLQQRKEAEKIRKRNFQSKSGP